MQTTIADLRQFFRPYVTVLRENTRKFKHAVKAKVRPYTRVNTLHRDLQETGSLLTLRAAGPLGRAGDSLILPDDKIICPHVLRFAAWDYANIQAFCAHVDREKAYILLDIGANIGLFSRQIERCIPKLQKLICIEPDVANFRALQYNLAHIRDRVEFCNIALGDADEDREMFRDADNIGNYSLNPDAMRDRQFDTAKVRVRDTRSWMAKAQDGSTPLLWKSDTQGFDELIVSATPIELWHRIDVALIEIWRIAKPNFDRDAFRLRLESFPNRQLDDKPDVSPDEILTYLSGNDYTHKDLLMWR